MAREKIYDPEKSIIEIAYEPAFKNPQHFTCLFKSKLGYTSQEYRMLN